MADTSEDWLLLPLEQAGVAFGVLSVACDSRDPRMASYIGRLEQLKPALTGIIEVFHAHNTMPTMATTRHSLVQDVSAAYNPLPSESQISPPATSTMLPVLSKREQEIAELLVAGYAAVNVAAVLGLSEHTVRTYVRRLYRKLGVSNRAQLVRSCVRSDVRSGAQSPG